MVRAGGESGYGNLYDLSWRFALGYLEKGRKGWDIPHTRAVFYYNKEITESTKGDMAVGPVAAILHDIGYYGSFENNSDKLKEVLDRKKCTWK